MLGCLKRGWAPGLVVFIMAILLWAQPAAAQTKVICVYSAMNTPGSGRCWSDPYRSLSDALSVAQPGDEIWVARGVYTTGVTADSTFTIRPGVALYGGFITTETLRTQRNWTANVTVLTGDLQRNDRTDARGVVTSTVNINGVNAHHVVMLDGSSAPITNSTRLDGFTITAGQATSATVPLGGGLVCRAEAAGGECSPTLSNLTFSGNLAQQGGGLSITAANRGRSDLLLTSVTFSGNRALENGGALYAAADSGGSISLPLTNALFRTNSAANGAAIYTLAQNGGATSPSLTNATLGRNAATNAGGALYNATGADIPLTNVILWDNTAVYGSQIYNDGSTPVINYSLVQGGDGGSSGSSGLDAFSRGVGNNAVDPLYGNAAAGNLGLLPASPAIDAGTTAAAPLVDLRGQPRPFNLIADMGAYEVQDHALAIKSGNGQAIAAGGAFRLPLIVALTSKAADPVGPGAVLTFTPPADGPGLTVTTPFTAATDASGVVTVPVTANNALGVYTVAVTARGVITPALFTLTNGCPSGRAYVNHAATGADSGVSWQDAYTELQEALRLAQACATFTEIWVARGVYTPGVTALSSFTVSSGVAVYGGFAATETLLSQRNWSANMTVLSGDLDNNDGKDANGVITNTAKITGTNAYHVVWMDGVTKPITTSTLLDGFTITGGRAKGGGTHNSGGGLVCFGQGAGKSCSPTITNVTLRGNVAAGSGGAMYNTGRISGVSNPTLVNVSFIGNTSVGSGAAMYNAGSTGTCSPLLTSVTFSGNVSSNHGGAIYNYALQGVSSPVLTNVVFSHNTAANQGGAMYNNGTTRGVSSPVLTNVLLIGNRAKRGAALYNNGGVEGNSSPHLTNVTFSRNTATDAGAVLYNYGHYAGTSGPTLTNVIMWGNTALSGTQIYNYSAVPTINFSLLQGGAGGIGGNSGTDAFSVGTGNLSASPLFVDAAAGLLDLLPGSPAIDAGTDAGASAFDLRGLPRPRVQRTDMGAYEMQGFTLAILTGDGQTADVGSPFALPLVAQISGQLGEIVGSGAIVVTPPSAGPGVSVTAPFTLSIDDLGRAWTGVTANSLAGVYTVTMTARGVLTPALFTLTNQYSLTVSASASPSSGGTVSSPDGSLYGETVTVVAAVNAGYTFVNWTENNVEVSTASTYSFALTADRTLVAHFAPSGPTTYSISVSADPLAGGAAGGGGQVNSGDIVTVTAAANSGYAFVNWTEGAAAVSTARVYTFQATGNRTLVAHFSALPPVTHTISISADPADGGSVSGGAQVTHGAEVTVTATSNPGYSFVNWTVAGIGYSTAPAYRFTATEDRTLVAHFAWNGPASYSVIVSAEPLEGGVVSGGGPFLQGSTTTVSATPNSGYAFAYWAENGEVVTTTSTYNFTVLSDRDLAAQFSQVTPEKVTIGVRAEPSNGGTVSGGGMVDYGETATVNATAKPQYEFVNWTAAGEVVWDEAEYSFAANVNQTLVANFRRIQYTIVTSAAPSEGGVVSEGGAYNAGDPVALTAAAYSGFTFVNWTEGGAPVWSTPAYTFTAAADRDLVANFLRIQYTIAARAEPSAGGTINGAGTYNAGAAVALTAAANSGYTFVNWTEGGAEVTTAATYNFTAASHRDLVANFHHIQYTIAASAEPSAGGTINGAGTYNAGDPVALTATPSVGYTFVNWTEGGAQVSTAATYNFTAAADRNLVAHFSALALPFARNDAAAATAGAPVAVAVTANDRDPAGGGLTVAAVGVAGHGAAVIAEDGRGIVYTPSADYAGVDSFSYEIADVNGSRDTGLVVIAVSNAAAGQGASQVYIVADPKVDSTALFSTSAASLDLLLPGGFYTGELAEEDVLLLVFVPMDRPSEQTGHPAPGFKFANLEFDLLAFHNAQPLTGIQFAVPVTITIVYSPAILGNLNPATLGLWYWTGSEWSTDGISLAAHDPVNHTITLLISHLSRFGLFAAEPTDLHMYLPLIRR